MKNYFILMVVALFTLACSSSDVGIPEFKKTKSKHITEDRRIE